jgi:imidazolonepropionase-like amidohydrolase
VWATADGNEITNPITPQIRGIDSLNPADLSFPIVLAAGVTAVYTGPGSANIVGGTGVVIKVIGKTVDEMLIPGTEAMKMALGENPKRCYGEGKKQAPATRMGNAAVLRDALVQAQNYVKKIEDAQAEAVDGKKPKIPDRDLKWEALAKVIKGEMMARIHAHRADDILTAVRIAEEFGLRYAIEHATEGYKIAEILAKKKVPCTVGPLLMQRSKMELDNVTLENAGLLAKAGVKVAIQCDTASNTRWLALHAGLAMREGMPEEDAWKSITINPAEITGVADRMGSLDAGKDADIVIWNGHPMSTFTKCETVFINGERVYDLPSAAANRQ